MIKTQWLKSACVVVTYCFAWQSFAGEAAPGSSGGTASDKDIGRLPGTPSAVSDSRPAARSTFATAGMKRPAVRPDSSERGGRRMSKRRKVLAAALIAAPIVGLSLAIAKSSNSSSSSYQGIGGGGRTCVAFVGGSGSQALWNKLLSTCP
jgi:hypothetical protein